MEEKQESIFTPEFEDGQSTVKPRWLILPLWIRVFTWLFLITGALVPFILVAGLFHIPIHESLYGLRTTDSNSAIGLSVSLLFLIKGFAAYGLFKGKKHGILYAQMEGVFSIIVCLGLMFYDYYSGGHINYRLEILVLGFYLYKISKLRGEWEQLPK